MYNSTLITQCISSAKQTDNRIQKNYSCTATDVSSVAAFFASQKWADVDCQVYILWCSKNEYSRLSDSPSTSRRITVSAAKQPLTLSVMTTWASNMTLSSHLFCNNMMWLMTVPWLRCRAATATKWLGTCRVQLQQLKPRPWICVDEVGSKF